MANYLMPHLDDILHMAVAIPAKGGAVSIGDIEYEVLSTATYQDEPGVFVTKAVLMEVTAEGEYADKDPITVDLSNTDFDY